MIEHRPRCPHHGITEHLGNGHWQCPQCKRDFQGLTPQQIQDLMDDELLG